MIDKSLFPNLGMGLGLRAQHYSHIAQSSPKIDWFEALSENYMGLSQSGPGRPLKILESIRKDHDIVLHGVSLSLGSTDELDFQYLEKLKSLSNIIQPRFISEHLCWTGVDGENLHDLLPLPFTKETIEHLTSRILKVQEFLGGRILLENISSYLTFKHSEMAEWDFLSEVSKRADCGILLDVNNVYVNSINHGFDPKYYLQNLPQDRIGQIHLAGHSKQGDILIDTHDGPVSSEVWDLFRLAVKLFGPVSTMVEWDSKIPDFTVLESEALIAKKIIQRERGGHSCEHSQFT
jgi:uncharacterized protein (UPF0276 family)